MDIKISVIVPIYNTEQYLRACLDSVFLQDFCDYEVVAVDDGTPDHSNAILEEYAKAHKNLVIVHQENQGLGGARNTGMQHSNGKYFLFLDSDDTMKPGTLSYLYATAEQNNADIVWFGMDYVDEAMQVQSTRKANEDGVLVVTQDERPLLYANDSYIWNKLYLASLFKDHDILFPKRAWYEDLRTLPKLVLHANKIALSDKVLYNYLQRSDSIMHVTNIERTAEMLDTVAEVLDYYKAQGAFQKYHDDLEYMTALHVMVLGALRIASVDPKHPLLQEFYAFTKTNFPDFQKNQKIKENFSFRHKMIFAFSKRKQFKMLYLLNKLNSLR